MMIVSRLFLALLLNLLWVIDGHTAPLLNANNTWGVFTPVIKTACSSEGQCLSLPEWLPMSQAQDGSVILPDGDDDATKMQSRRQIANPMPQSLKLWKDLKTLEDEDPGVRTSVPDSKLIRIKKKDMYLSGREWSTGGLPFSVLYMNSHGSRIHATKSTSQRQRPSTTSPPPSVQPRPTHQRNRQSTMPPKQYLTIPQLIISYRWGAFGK